MNKIIKIFIKEAVRVTKISVLNLIKKVRSNTDDRKRNFFVRIDTESLKYRTFRLREFRKSLSGL